MIEEQGIKIPDIMIAGVPKSGTTFLFNALANHPSICPSTPKETYYHIHAENPYSTALRYTDYAQFFKESGLETLHLEGSQLNLFEEGLIDTITKLTKKPKVLVVLRDPAIRIYSSFQYTSNNLAAIKDLSFESYVNYLLNGDTERIKIHCKNEKIAFSMTNELNFSNYAWHLNNWSNAVGKENLMVMLSNDLKEAPDVVVEKCFVFLGLEPSNLNTVEIGTNSTHQVKNKRLHYLLNNIYAQLGYQVPFKKSLKKLYAKLQFGSTEMSSSDKVAIQRLRLFFRESNSALEDTFGLDVKMWNFE